MPLTVSHIATLLRTADRAEFEVLERSLVADTRKGVRSALDAARRRLDAADAERHRLEGLYDFERALREERGASIAVGLDEVGRGSIAGPLAVGAVVLPDDALIASLNDSKQLKPADRERIAAEVKRTARAWTIQYVEPEVIDAVGMTASLVRAFHAAVSAIEAQGVLVDLVLLDGNPLHFDKREVNIVKGYARCASIAAASVVAKVERDALMRRLALEYPAYAFDECKGYASPAHIAAIGKHGLTPVHRATFCTAFLQDSLF